MTLEEAERIARERTPDEPAEDWLASWQAARPRPEPERKAPKLDTMQTDVRDEIRSVVDRERKILTEATGLAIAEIRDETLDEVDAAIAKAVEQLRAEFAGQLAQLRCQTDTLGGELKARLEQIIARKRRARAAKTNAESDITARPVPLQLPGPGANGNGHAQ
jgi:hypothetical protein